MREGIPKERRKCGDHRYVYLPGVSDLCIRVETLTADMRIPSGVIEDSSANRASVYGSRSDAKCLQREPTRILWGLR